MYFRSKFYFLTVEMNMCFAMFLAKTEEREARLAKLSQNELQRRVVFVLLELAFVWLSSCLFAPFAPACSDLA